MSEASRGAALPWEAPAPQTPPIPPGELELGKGPPEIDQKPIEIRLDLIHKSLAILGSSPSPELIDRGHLCSQRLLLR